MSETPTFWNNDHPLSAKSEELFKQLIPFDGNCPSLQGELLRASTKISYDWFNNGWGCNNWSGAVVFLQKFFKDLPVQPAPEVIAKLHHELSYAHEFSHGERAPRSDDRSDFAVTTIHEIVVQAVLDNPMLIANTRDMYDFSESDAHCYDCDVEQGG
jgi:hypothetical protein